MSKYIRSEFDLSVDLNKLFASDFLAMSLNYSKAFLKIENKDMVHI